MEVCLEGEISLVKDDIMELQKENSELRTRIDTLNTHRIHQGEEIMKLKAQLQKFMMETSSTLKRDLPTIAEEAEGDEDDEDECRFPFKHQCKDELCTNHNDKNSTFCDDCEHYDLYPGITIWGGGDKDKCIGWAKSILDLDPVPGKENLYTFEGEEFELHPGDCVEWVVTDQSKIQKLHTKYVDSNPDVVRAACSVNLPSRL